MQTEQQTTKYPIKWIITTLPYNNNKKIHCLDFGSQMVKVFTSNNKEHLADECVCEFARGNYFNINCNHSYVIHFFEFSFLTMSRKEIYYSLFEIPSYPHHHHEYKVRTYLVNHSKFA